MNLFNELRYTCKALLKNYWFTLLCASVLAVGLSIVLPMYALTVNLAFKTPDFSDGDRFVALRQDLAAGASRGITGFDGFHYRYFKDNSRSFSDLYAWRNLTFAISDGDYNEVFASAEVEPALMQMPQVQPGQGRLFTDEDVQLGASPVALISHDIWQSYYAGREDIIGLGSSINGQTRTIVGVMPPGFRFPLVQDVWIPLALPGTVNAGEGEEDLLVVGKLNSGVSLAQASNEVSLLQASILAGWPQQYGHIGSSQAVPYIGILAALSPGGGAILLTIFASMLLLVAFNIGNLFLARGEERLAELAIRSAVGATPASIALALLLESLVVCCFGLAGGWLLGYLAIDWLGSMIGSAGAPGGLALSRLFWWDMSLNGNMLATSSLVVVLAWLVSGGLPAWRVSRGNISELLASGGKGQGDKGVTRLSKVLVNLQLVIGLLLLTLGVMLGQTYLGGTTTTTTGADQLYVGTVAFRGTPLVAHQQQQQYLDNLGGALMAEQGVQQVAFATAVPGTFGNGGFYSLEEQDLKANDSYPRAFLLSTSVNYLDIFGVALNAGRYFNGADTEESLPVIVIDQRLAAKYWPDGDAIGKRMQINPESDTTWYTIVGVSQPVVQESSLDAGQEGTPIIYRPVTQAITPTMQAITQMSSMQLTPSTLFRNAANKVDRAIPLSNPMTLRDLEIRSADGEQVNRNLAAALMFIALYVTGIATYGLASRIAGRRRIETGIRMALGASRGDSLKVFITHGFKTVMMGLGLGSVLSILLVYATLTSAGTASFSLLVPATLTISLLLALLIILANYIPARRIIAMEPADALRYE